ncbi:transcription regulator Fur family [Staphylococcus gallinarum]|uniref:Peroxide-responsive repressor PerR n=1 Tax=Staphylococcus gallinarum TaxID=1293 RepID=A0A380FIX3_STAGA|nr:transcription regulator Fur family [Staphylococcus gallinarum]
MVNDMSAEMDTIEHELEDSIASLRNAGIRITPQRQAILKYLIASETHPTADEIYQALSPDFPNISVATIYIITYVSLRILDSLKNCLMVIPLADLTLIHIITTM